MPEVFQADGSRYLVLSPHYDDAALSCGALLEIPQDVHVATVFTAPPVPVMSTSWDQLCGFSDSDQAMAGRAAEERAAFADRADRHGALPLVEGQYFSGPRPDGDADALLDFTRDWLSRGEGRNSFVCVPAGAGVQLKIAALIGKSHGSRRARLKRILGPLGPWLRRTSRTFTQTALPTQNADHCFVRDIIVGEYVRNPSFGLVLYEELPYLWGASADPEIERLCRSHRLTSTCIERDINRDVKAKRVAAYRSQLRHLYAPHGPLGEGSSLPAAERYFVMRKRGSGSD